jgi:hypothetical protein
MPHELVSVGGLVTMPDRLINDAPHWRARAEETRAVAEGVHDLFSRDALLRIADAYDRLAERTEQRAEERAREMPAAVNVQADGIPAAGNVQADEIPAAGNVQAPIKPA